MADEDSDIDLGEDSGAAAAPAKKGGLGGILPTILKYVALALGAIILIVTVVIITMNIMGGNKTRQTQIPISEEYREYAEELDWYTSLGEIQTRTSDAQHASVVVNIFLGYKKDDKIASAEITAQKIPIRDFLRNYFADKTVEELTPKNEEKLKIEIRNEINDTILNKSKIRKISFDKLNVVQQ
ncbi:flagellar basal body-associated FliL family protein [Treponema sp.]|uniref:flagellar basal body-associated FliL family protein n=1 Tax=Treponema sp. TaxID=166 RepID=UPI00298E9C16|nr:flagellar basal body-associated FliL family protein [Treponema sp.]MCR5613428.1 flagellar basal body-associated FliL family protein [Treponema sp.]